MVTAKFVHNWTDVVKIGVEGNDASLFCRRPVNDLSRGCKVSDVVSTVVITAIQAAATKSAMYDPPAL